jgi:stage V sporulation protein D (sporulation-specific penicillin-binding protein)
MSNYLREDMTGKGDMAISALKAKIRDYLLRKMDTPVESVEIQRDLEDDMVEIISSWQDPALFFVVNHLYVNPLKVSEPEVLATRLSWVIGMSEEDIIVKFEKKKKRHLEIIRKMNVSTRDAVMTRLANERQAIKNKELTLEDSIVPFIKIEDNLVRFYPEKNITGQITGFVDGDGIGRYGIEGYFEDLLQAESPTERVIKDNANRPIDGYVSRGLITSKNGIDISLTIDRNIQKEIWVRLERAIKQFKANKWSIIVMDPITWAVRAMVNYPDYDPNNYTQVYEMEPVSYNNYKNPYFELFGTPLYVVDTLSGTTFANIDGQRLKLREAEDREVINYSITKYKYKNGYGSAVYSNDIVSAFYEPGSVFKAVTTAIGIDTWEISPDDTYLDKGYVELTYEAGRKGRISNVASQCTWRHSYIHALNWSCNVGMISIIGKIGPSLFHKYLGDFDFEQRPILPSTEKIILR